MNKPREQRIAELAARQRGLVTRKQLLEIGLTPEAIDHWLRSARLHRLYRGVYLLGHAGVTDGARELGAVLACGRGAVISHRSAAWLWRLLAAKGDVEVTVAVAIAARDLGSGFTAFATSTAATSASSAGSRSLRRHARSSTWRPLLVRASWSKRSPRRMRGGSRAAASSCPYLPAVHPSPAPEPSVHSSTTAAQRSLAPRPRSDSSP
jgi:Transcriptional regulator, AbiEi antitoxin